MLMGSGRLAAIEQRSVMQPHVHISAVHGIAVIALVLAVFGTAHLLALTNDNRFGRALLALGF